MKYTKLVVLSAMASFALSSCNTGSTSATASSQGGTGATSKSNLIGGFFGVSSMSSIGREFEKDNYGVGFPSAVYINSKKLNADPVTGEHYLSALGGNEVASAEIVADENTKLGKIIADKPKAKDAVIMLEKFNMNYKMYSKLRSDDEKNISALLIDKNNVTPEYMYGFQGLEPQTIINDDIPTITLPNIKILNVYVYPKSLEDSYTFSFSKIDENANALADTGLLAKGTKGDFLYKVFSTSTGQSIAVNIVGKSANLVPDLNKKFSSYKFVQVQFPFFYTKYYNDEWNDAFVIDGDSSKINLEKILKSVGQEENDRLYADRLYKTREIDDRPIEAYAPVSVRSYELCTKTIKKVTVTEFCDRRSDFATDPTKTGNDFFYEKVSEGLANFDRVVVEPTGQWPAGSYQNKAKDISSYHGVVTATSNGGTQSVLDSSLCADGSDILLDKNKLTCEEYNNPPPVSMGTSVFRWWYSIFDTADRWFNVKIDRIDSWNSKNNKVTVKLVVQDENDASIKYEGNKKVENCPSNKVVAITSINGRFGYTKSISDIWNDVDIECIDQKDKDDSGVRTLPDGSYDGSRCKDEFINTSTNLLYAQCMTGDKDNNFVPSVLDVSACGDFDLSSDLGNIKIRNSHGQLACAAPFGKYLNEKAVNGSYLEQCKDISYNETSLWLSGYCLDKKNKYVWNNSFKYGNCNANSPDVDVDDNGKFQCGAKAQEDTSFRPTGTYTSQCSFVSWDQSAQALTVSCQNVKKTLSYGDKCRYPSTVSYINKQLVCDKSKRDDL